MLQHMNQALYGENVDAENGAEEEREESHEVPVVLLADAVVHPWAVMIVALDALVARGTVARARGTHDEAARTQMDRIYELHELQKVNVIWLGDEAGVTELRDEPENYREESESDTNVKLPLFQPHREQHQREHAVGNAECEEEGDWHLEGFFYFGEAGSEHKTAAGLLVIQVGPQFLAKFLVFDVGDEVERRLILLALDVP